MHEVCVIDANGQFVAVVDRDTYQLREGEQFVEAAPPTLRPAAGYPGMVKPVWNGSEWVESATFEEMILWEFRHRKPADEVEGETLWDTLEDAYREGVNNAYDQ